MTLLTIRRVRPHSVAKIAAVVSLLASLVFFVPFFLLSLGLPAFGARSGGGAGMGFFVLMPLIYGAMTYVFTWTGCWFYNLLAPHLGGIEIDVERDN